MYTTMSCMHCVGCLLVNLTGICMYSIMSNQPDKINEVLDYI